MNFFPYQVISEEYQLKPEDISNFGTLVKLQRYLRNTTSIPVKNFAFLGLEQIRANFGLKRFKTGSLV